MTKNASNFSYRLANLGKIIGDHSMKGGEKVIKIALAVALVGGAAIGGVIGRTTKK